MKKKFWNIKCMIPLIVIGVILVGLAVAYIINCFFKKDLGITCLQPEWTAGEALGYAGTIISAFGTLVLGYCTIYLNHKNENENRLLKNRPVIKISKSEIKFSDDINSCLQCENDENYRTEIYMKEDNSGADKQKIVGQAKISFFIFSDVTGRLSIEKAVFRSLEDSTVKEMEMPVKMQELLVASPEEETMVLDIFMNPESRLYEKNCTKQSRIELYFLFENNVKQKYKLKFDVFKFNGGGTIIPPNPVFEVIYDD